ncbi:hypothetical protein AVEN_160051-1 [Araneus ventricosus]|uniref:Uncharacterized protein n=1 Tax=Araneus ventricosus TaxID=182803 RepID=A0A4Y2ET09_ARAVE|nr:hypothetical protein AVEN_102283-1 [Araneus ventricosus]GBL67436.1 hypothetical protein AVEN_20627-1 [Araneus ventricosus]GBM31108.1 hypothetical protein AVEN_236179-1 [Araneus ventricosus]GBM31166.1 hypothetical protein AVEN_160051-1 [Araneus ventricosus]
MGMSQAGYNNDKIYLCSFVSNGLYGAVLQAQSLPPPFAPICLTSFETVVWKLELNYFSSPDGYMRALGQNSGRTLELGHSGTWELNLSSSFLGMLWEK